VKNWKKLCAAQWGGGILLIIALAFTSCPNVVDEDTAPVSKEELTAKTAEAQAAVAGPVVSVDGTDVDIGTEWVSQGAKDALEAAIAAARAVLDDQAASQGQVNEALSALTSALAAFNEAKQDGLKADKTTLAAAITAANAAKDGIVVSVDGIDIDVGTAWVSQGALDALNAAIAAAQTVADNPAATPDAIAQAVITLNAAVETFDGAKQDGLRADKTTLTAAITAANAAKDGIVVSVDGTDIFVTIEWVSQEALDTLNAAITTAQAVVDNPTAAPAAIAQAVAALNAAVTSFIDAKEEGTKAADAAALAAAITAANAAKDGVAVSAVAGEVFSGIEWVSQGALDTLNAAITATQTVVDNPAATTAEIIQAVNALNAAAETFKGAKQAGTKAAELALRYDFTNVNNDTIPDLAGGDNPGTLAGGATVNTENSVSYMYTGTGNGYVDLGGGTGQIITGQDAFTISAYVNTNGSLNGEGWFLWMFSSLEPATQTEGSYIYFRPVNTRHVLSLNGWGSETAVINNTMLEKNTWKHVLIRQTLYDADIFIDGIKVAGGKVLIKPTGLTANGPLVYNYLAKPCFNGDNYMKDTKFTDFRIYKGALSNAEIGALDIAGTLLDMNNYTLQDLVDSAANRALASLGDTSTVAGDLSLPQGDAFVNVNWTSSNPGVLSNTGEVTRPAGSHATVTLTGVFSPAFGSAAPVTQSWTVRVMKADAVFEDFLVVNLEVDNTGNLVNTAPGTAYGNPSLSGTASVITSTVGETEYKAIDTGASGYIDLGPKLGGLLRKTQWTIEFYLNTPSDAGDMLAFANEETPASRGTVRFFNGGLNFRTQTAGSGGTQTNTGNSGGIGARAGKWVHLVLVRNGNNILIFRNGGVAQNNRDRDFSALTTNDLFGPDPEVSLDSLRYGYLGKPLFASTANVANVKFYGFKAYSAAIVPHQNSGDWYLDGSSTAGPITETMRTFKAALNAAFGLEDSTN
jgi:hypothetical protein